MIIETIVSVATGLYTLVSKISVDRQNISREQRTAMVGLFESIATTIEHTAACIESGDIPHGDCAALAHYASRLPQVMSGVIPESHTTYYSDLLHRAHQIEHLARLMRDEDVTPIIVKLREAAGIYTAAAALIPVS